MDDGSAFHCLLTVGRNCFCMNLYYSNLFGIGWDILASAFNSARVTMAGKRDGYYVESCRPWQDVISDDDIPLSVRWLHPPSLPTCYVDRTTIFVNPTSEENSAWYQMVHSSIFPTILFEISDRALRRYEYVLSGHTCRVFGPVDWSSLPNLTSTSLLKRVLISGSFW